MVEFWTCALECTEIAFITPHIPVFIHQYISLQSVDGSPFPYLNLSSVIMEPASKAPAEPGRPAPPPALGYLVPEEDELRADIEKTIPSLEDCKALLQACENDIDFGRRYPNEANQLRLYGRGISRERQYLMLKDHLPEPLTEQHGDDSDAPQVRPFVLPPAETLRSLERTSQGTRQEIPPRLWLESELIAFGARREWADLC